MTAAAQPSQLSHLYRPIAELCQPGKDDVAGGPGELGRGENREVGGPGQPPPAHPGREAWQGRGRCGGGRGGALDVLFTKSESRDSSH